MLRVMLRANSFRLRWLALLSCGCGGATAAATQADGGVQDAGAVDVATDHGDEATVAEAGDSGTGGDAAEEAPVGKPLAGFIEFEALPKGYGDFYAAFDGNAFSDDDNCKIASYGPSCVLYSCLPRPADAGPSPTAGTMTIAGGVLDGGVTVDAKPPGEYSYDLGRAPFLPGQTVGASASGAAVPAFPTANVVGPAPLTVTAPGLDGGSLSVPTSQDLPIAWSGGQAGSRASFEAYGYAANSASTFLTLYCEFDAVSGQGLVPKAALAPLSGASQGALLWGQRNVVQFDAGKWSVSLTASSYVSAFATFQ